MYLNSIHALYILYINIIIFHNYNYYNDDIIYVSMCVNAFGYIL